MCGPSFLAALFLFLRSLFFSSAAWLACLRGGKATFVLDEAITAMMWFRYLRAKVRMHGISCVK